MNKRKEQETYQYKPNLGVGESTLKKEKAPKH